MKIHGGKTLAKKDRAAANRVVQMSVANAPTLQLADNRPTTARLRVLQQTANNSSPVKQLQSYQDIADNHIMQPAEKATTTTGIVRSMHSGTTPGANGNTPVIQRMIGDGGDSLHGRIVIGPRGKRYKIVGHDFAFGNLLYTLKDDRGNQRTVDPLDNNFDLEPSVQDDDESLPEADEKDQAMQVEPRKEKKKKAAPKTKRKRSNSKNESAAPKKERTTRSKSRKVDKQEESEDPPVTTKRRRTGSVSGSSVARNTGEKKKDKKEVTFPVRSKKKRSRSKIKFSVARREGGARTNTRFNNSTDAINVMVDDCNISEGLAKSLVDKADWSYPMMQDVMSELQEQGTLQPGLQEGVRLWESSQPSFNYTLETTENGSPLAQLVGCHLMEYQETNNGTQGPIQSKDESRKKQQRLSAAILSLPEEQAPVHSLGLGLPEHANLFPAMFDVKLEDKKNKLFAKTAGAKTFKIYQSALSNMDPQYTIYDTLVDDARQDRRDQVKSSLETTAFDADKEESSDEDYFKSELGLKDTESDHSMEEDAGWKFKYTPEKVGKWTVQKLYDYVFKRNVYSGVIYKDTAAKLAELDILEEKTKSSSTKKKSSELKRIEKSRKRRTGVQSRVKQADDALLETMQKLGVNTVSLYQRLQQWNSKSNILTSGTPLAKHKKTVNDYKTKLDAYSKMTLTQLQKQGYPPPLKGIGNATLKQLMKK